MTLLQTKIITLWCNLFGIIPYRPYFGNALLCYTMTWLQPKIINLWCNLIVGIVNHLQILKYWFCWFTFLVKTSRCLLLRQRAINWYFIQISLKLMVKILFSVCTLNKLVVCILFIFIWGTLKKIWCIESGPFVAPRRPRRRPKREKG